eukprot:6285613-Amphidinium_carterae.1
MQKRVCLDIYAFGDSGFAQDALETQKKSMLLEDNEQILATSMNLMMGLSGECAAVASCASLGECQRYDNKDVA